MTSQTQAAFLSTTDYLSEIQLHLQTMEKQPWDYHQRKIDHQRLSRRLSGERDAVIALLDNGEPILLPHLLIRTETTGDWKKLRHRLELTLQSWRAQSHPMVKCTCLLIGPITPAQQTEIEALLEPLSGTLRTFNPEQSWFAKLDVNDFLIAANPGDLFHPALGVAVALQDANRDLPCDALSWNRIQAEPNALSRYGARAYLRSPGPASLTLLGADYTGRAIGFRVQWLVDQSNEIRRCLSLGWIHPLLCHLASSAQRRWHHHPEYLSISDAPAATSASSNNRLHPSYDMLCQSLYAAPWTATGQPGPRPGKEPEPAQQGISVVIPFRDHADDTIAAIEAITAQKVSTWIEVVLVNNGSAEENLIRVKDSLKCLEAATGEFSSSVIDYPNGFSHSRQCNLGASKARGDVIVILNNDAFLKSPDCLDQISRWTYLPGVATVGAQVCDRHGRTVCAGFSARLRSGMDFEATIEEGREVVMQGGIKEVIGNTGACFAIRKERFFEVGGFNERVYPIGFNDVDLCLRLAKAGYKHLYLGWIAVEHQPGTSRGSADEVMQKVSARNDHPWVPSAAQFQLGTDSFYRCDGNAPETSDETAAPVQSRQGRIMSTLHKLGYWAKQMRQP